MNFITRKFKAFYNILSINYKWQKDGKFCRKGISSKDIFEINEKNIVVLAPHSDDEWIGCGCLLMKNPKNVTVINMDMPGGDDEALHKLRYNEMSGISKKFGYLLITAEGNKETFLERFLKKHQADIVFLPCYLDWHEEHKMVMDMFEKAAEQAGFSGKVAMYQVSLPIPCHMINFGSLMNKKELSNKWKNLKKYYPTQKFLPVKRFLINEHINGKIGGSYGIEAYSVLNFNDWKDEYGKNSLCDKEIKFLKENLQNIRATRECLKKFLEDKSR